MAIQQVLIAAVLAQAQPRAFETTITANASTAPGGVVYQGLPIDHGDPITLTYRYHLEFGDDVEYIASPQSSRVLWNAAFDRFVGDISISAPAGNVTLDADRAFSFVVNDFTLDADGQAPTINGMIFRATAMGPTGLASVFANGFGSYTNVLSMAANDEFGTGVRTPTEADLQAFDLPSLFAPGVITVTFGFFALDTDEFTTLQTFEIPLVAGDIDGDGDADGADARALVEAIDAGLFAGDQNGDGERDIFDVIEF